MDCLAENPELCWFVVSLHELLKALMLGIVPASVLAGLLRRVRLMAWVFYWTVPLLLVLEFEPGITLHLPAYAWDGWFTPSQWSWLVWSPGLLPAAGVVFWLLIESPPAWGGVSQTENLLQQFEATVGVREPADG